jgi:hypothetical protein
VCLNQILFTHSPWSFAGSLKAGMLNTLNSGTKTESSLNWGYPNRLPIPLLRRTWAKVGSKSSVSEVKIAPELVNICLRRTSK